MTNHYARNVDSINGRRGDGPRFFLKKSQQAMAIAQLSNLDNRGSQTELAEDYSIPSNRRHQDRASTCEVSALVFGDSAPP